MKYEALKNSRRSADRRPARIHHLPLLAGHRRRSGRDRLLFLRTFGSVDETEKIGSEPRRRYSLLPAMNSAFLEQTWQAIAPMIPASLRRFPDLTNDFCHEGEVKLRVPFYAQTDPYSCGAIAGWMVVETFHPKAGFAGFYKTCRPDPINGTPAHRLIRALRLFGVGVSIRRDLDFDAIAEAIESGFPVIAGAGNEHYDDGDHWVVIYGVARKRRRVFVCNNVRRGHSRIELSWRDWKAWWNPVGEGLVCWGKTLR